jgi:hypothetical protein
VCLDRRAGDRDLAEVLGHQSTDRVDVLEVLLIELDTHDLLEVVDREAASCPDRCRPP